MVEGIRANGRENQDLHASRDIAAQCTSSIDGKRHWRPTALYERCAGRHSHTQGPYPTIPFEHTTEQDIPKMPAPAVNQKVKQPAHFRDLHRASVAQPHTHKRNSTSKAKQRLF